MAILWKSARKSGLIFGSTFKKWFIFQNHLGEERKPTLTDEEESGSTTSSCDEVAGNAANDSDTASAASPTLGHYHSILPVFFCCFFIPLRLRLCDQSRLILSLTWCRWRMWSGRQSGARRGAHGRQVVADARIPSAARHTAYGETRQPYL